MRRTWRALRRRWGRALAAWALPPLVRAWRASCRRRLWDDPRPALRAAGQPYVYALLHAHQVAALLAHDEPAPYALVSRSRDGTLLARVLAAVGVQCVHGSSRKDGRDKGGAAALATLRTRLGPRAPVIVAVDGPRGPAGYVRRGALTLAAQAGAVVLPVAVTARRRWVLRRTWDQTQLPWPGATLDVHFAAPLVPPAGLGEVPEAVQAWVTATRPQLQQTLAALAALNQDAASGAAGQLVERGPGGDGHGA